MVEPTQFYTFDKIKINQSRFTDNTRPW